MGTSGISKELTRQRTPKPAESQDHSSPHYSAFASITVSEEFPVLKRIFPKTCYSIYLEKYDGLFRQPFVQGQSVVSVRKNTAPCSVDRFSEKDDRIFWKTIAAIVPSIIFPKRTTASFGKRHQWVKFR
jgi:hypothetical protein